MTLSWCFEDEGGAYATGVLDSLRRSEAVAAHIWPLEVVNGLVVAERRDRLDAASGGRFLELLESLPVTVDPLPPRRAFSAFRDLARAYRLSAYDAAYLDLAVRLALPLATLDERLRGAASQAGVPAYRPA